MPRSMRSGHGAASRAGAGRARRASLRIERMRSAAVAARCSRCIGADHAEHELVRLARERDGEHDVAGRVRAPNGAANDEEQRADVADREDEQARRLREDARAARRGRTACRSSARGRAEAAPISSSRPKSAHLLRGVGAQREIGVVAGAALLGRRLPASRLLKCCHAQRVADERRDREEQEQQQDRLQPCEQDDRQRQLDARRRSTQRQSAPTCSARCPRCGSARARRRTRRSRGAATPDGPCAIAAMLVGQVDHVLVGDLDEEHVQRGGRRSHSGARAAAGRSPSASPCPRRARRTASVTPFECERRQRRARVAQQRQREDREHAAAGSRARPRRGSRGTPRTKLTPGTSPPGGGRARRSGRSARGARRACRPRSTRPCSSTTIRSARRTVEKRCEMRIVVSPRVSSRNRSKNAASARTSRLAVGSSSTSTLAPPSTAISARAIAMRCHWPPESSAPSVYARESVVSRPCGSASTSSSAPARSSAARIALVVVQQLDRAEADVVAHRQLVVDEVLEDRGDAAPPRAARVTRVSRTPSTSDAARLRLVEPREQLDERRLAGAVQADDRERLAGRDRQVEAAQHRPLRRRSRTTRRSKRISSRGSPAASRRGPVVSPRPRRARSSRSRPTNARSPHSVW